MNFIDSFLNKITMYRVVLYGLTILAVIAIIFSGLGLLSFNAVNMTLGLVVLVVTCFVVNYAIAKILRAPTNIESNFITAFILFFILLPITAFSQLWMYVLVGALAMASKYILAIYKKHVCNPAAIAVLIVGLFGSGIAGWWVGSLAMLVPTLILGLLVLRKLQRFTLFFSFLVPALAAIAFVGVAVNHLSFVTVMLPVFVSWPIIFFGTIMLTEPQTTPPTRKMQVVYGALVGVLFGAQFSVGPVYSTPELALVLGNIFAYIVSPKQKLFLKLADKKLVADNTYEFSFVRADGKPLAGSTGLPFRAGQYLEWTLEHGMTDSRGNRRYFTIASAPTEDTIKLGIRTTPVNPSSFKKALVALPLGGMIVAGSLAGEFTLPRNAKQKLVFIAGGIGVTPFRSMIQNLLDTHESRDIVHFYSNKFPNDVAYKDMFDRAAASPVAGGVGVRTVYALTDVKEIPADWHGSVSPGTAVEVGGFVDKAMILKHVPDFADRMFYISGPRGMVVMFEKMLTGMGVKPSHIRSDFFPGFA